MRGSDSDKPAVDEELKYAGRFFRHVSLPGRLWKLSCMAYERNWKVLAWCIKMLNFFFFRALLPYQCDIASDVMLTHQGVGCAFSHSVTIGKRVKISHHVGLAAYAGRIVVEDDVTIDMHALILGPRGGGVRTIGKGSVIGSGAVVDFDVPAGSLVNAASGHLV